MCSFSLKAGLQHIDAEGGLLSDKNKSVYILKRLKCDKKLLVSVGVCRQQQKTI